MCWRSTKNQRMNLKELNVIKEASQSPALQRVSFPLEKIDDKSTKGKPFSFSQVRSMPVRYWNKALKLSPSTVPLAA